MKIRNDVVKVYKAVHIWVGIVSGLMLFIAFYAGAITMFEKPLERWATPPSSLAAAPPLARAEALLQAVRAEHPQAAANYRIVVEPTPDAPARLIWREPGPNRRQFKEFGASFAADGSLQVEPLRKAPVAQLIDTLHQQVGLPFADAVTRPIMGAVSLLYVVALVSGLIIFLPTLAKDLLALRIGRNLKRLWLDVHNALGVVSLPFHLVMALTCIVFAYHDEFYTLQEKLLYGADIEWAQHEGLPAAPPGAQPLAAEELLRRVQAQLPGFEVDGFEFENRRGQLEASVTGLDVRHGTRRRTFAKTHLDVYTGAVDTHDLPGHMEPWDSAVNTFFMLHFGSFGGNPVRWLYLLLGLAGALLFYSGNLLWIESRRRRQRGAGLPEQKRSTRVLASLTVGVSVGCVLGISATLAATKWLPQRVADPAAWHEGIYYACFAAAIAWAFVRAAPRAAVELLWLAALLTLAIPASSLAGAWGLGGAWHHPGPGLAIDLTALLAVPTLLLLARCTARRARAGDADSVWSQQPAAARESQAQGTAGLAGER